MAVQFHYSKDMVRVLDLEEGSLVDKLRPAVYYIKYNQFVGFFLEKEHDLFKVPERLFGPITRRVAKIKTTYDDRENGTGILLTGDKGSGKTMLAEVLCNTMIQGDVPVLIINERYTGSNFTSFIDSLGEVCIFFDEFGKLYPTKQRDTDEDNNSQEALLSLLDGVNRQKRMVIMTENAESDINTFIKARPGRVFYHFKYSKLDEETIKEFTNSEKINNDITEFILDASRKMDAFSFDTLKAIVEEYHRFGGDSSEGIEAILVDLNIEYDKDKKIKLKVIRLMEKATEKNIEITFESTYHDKPTHYHDDIYVEVKKGKDAEKDVETDKKKGGEDESEWVNFNAHNIVYTNEKKIIFENDEHLLVTEIIEDFKTSYNYAAF